MNSIGHYNWSPRSAITPKFPPFFIKFTNPSVRKIPNINVNIAALNIKYAKRYLTFF